jgi:hypothetical protein
MIMFRVSILGSHSLLHLLSHHDRNGTHSRATKKHHLWGIDPSVSCMALCAQSTERIK